MTQPKRVQRRRTKGYRLPSTAVYIGRGSRWGNPFTVEEHGREQAIALYREQMVEHKQRDPTGYRALLEPLIGKDVACFCSLEQACHGDVLLKLVSQLEEPCQS